MSFLKIYPNDYPPPSEEVHFKEVLPTDSAARKNLPLVSGCLDYFPAALAAVAAVSRAGNEKHNPGQPLHHARGKSMDHADCIARHLMDRGTVDADDGMRHSAKVAWRALAMLQEELEREEGAPLARGAKAEPTKDDHDDPDFQAAVERRTNSFTELLYELGLAARDGTIPAVEFSPKARSQSRASPAGRRQARQQKPRAKVSANRVR